MHKSKLIFYILFGCLVLFVSISHAGQTIKEDFGGIKEGSEEMSITVENGTRLVITASKNNRYFVFVKFSRGEALKLVKRIEKALIDAKKPLRLSKNQTSEKDYGTFRYGETFSVSLHRDSDGSTLCLLAADEYVIKTVHLWLNEAKAQSFLSILQKATASMNK
jgi:hypothetical protein